MKLSAWQTILEIMILLLSAFIDSRFTELMSSENSFGDLLKGDNFFQQTKRKFMVYSLSELVLFNRTCQWFLLLKKVLFSLNTDALENL